MTDADHYSRPEMACERKIAKRYRAAIQKRGLCLVCTHRDREATYWGKNVCSIGQARMHPQCDKDGRGFRFTVDAEAIEQFKRAA